ncbi:MAG: methyltransferase domain-containing protein [Methylotenera sp.]|nr:methyltransferase domain-containing protein [Oligoflexia bacterium]
MTSFCSYYRDSVCRSCQWIERSYLAQIAEKEGLIRSRLAFLGDVQLEPPALSALTGFRNRAKMTVTGSVTHPVIGLVGESELDQGRELLECPVHHPRLNELISFLPAWLARAGVEPYQIRERTGELKGLIAFHSPRGKSELEAAEMYLRFVLRSRACLDRLRKNLPELLARFPDLKCVSANLQPIPHAILEGHEEVYLTERRTISHRLGAVVLKLSPQAFVQTNVSVAVALYQKAAEWIQELGPSRFLELYCGQGAFSLTAAGSAAKNFKALGIEINPDAVQSANETASDLGLSQVSFRCLDATKVGQELKEFAPELVLVNPPRRGLGEGVELLKSALPENLLYSSCSLPSLEADLRALEPFYSLKKVQLFDLFPHTHHFETLVWLVRRNG